MPTSPRVPRRAVAAAALLGLAALAGCGDPPPGARPSGPRPAGATAMQLVERAEAAGLTFRMEFLPLEQGEDFKVNLYDHGCGVAVADVDGDGWDDVYFCNQLGRNALFRNRRDGTFEDVTAAAGVAVDGRISVAATFADLDADGDEDLYVTTTRGGNVCFRNRGDGTFEDVTRALGLELVAHSEQAFCFDADGDGDLDLLVTNTAAWTTGTWDEGARYWRGPSDLFKLLDNPVERNRFYRQRPDGTFEDATDEAGLGGPGWGGDVAVLDVDDDGDLDLFLANMFGRSSLLENDGRGRFTDATARCLGRTPWGAVGARAADVDGDGRLDLLVVDMHSDMWMDVAHDPASLPETLKFDGPFGPMKGPDATATILKLRYRVEDVTFGNALYLNRGEGRFVEVSDRAGFETLWPWGVATADFDADGDLDVFVPTGMGFPYRAWRSPLLENQGAGTFVDRAAAAGTDPWPGGPVLRAAVGGKDAARSARSAATGDFDRDGREDLVVSTFNDRALLWSNVGPKRPWIGLRLVGPGRNRAAVGATVRVRAGGRTLLRAVETAGGYLAQSARTLTVPLGGAARPDEVEVRWPDGRRQRVTGLEPGRVHEVRYAPDPVR